MSKMLFYIFVHLLHVCVRACVSVYVCAATISCQSTADPPPLSSSDRIPQVLGFVFQTAVGGEEKQTGRRFPTRVFFTRFTVQEKNKLSVIIFFS